MPEEFSVDRDAEALRIDFPFQATFVHPGVDVHQMFQISRDLDFHELREPVEALEKVRNDLIVDMLYVHETETRIEVKPRKPMNYEDIAAEMEVLVDHMTSLFKGKVKLGGIEWLVNRKGLASDQRSTQRRVL